MINLFKATGSAFGLAMLCTVMAWGCGGAANSVEHNKANFAPQNQDNQTSALSGDAFFTLQNHKIAPTSATTAGPAQASKSGSSLNHWHLE